MSMKEKFQKWSKMYGALIIALCCLYNLITFGINQWMIAMFWGFGFLICGFIAFMDIKNHIRRKK